MYRLIWNTALSFTLNLTLRAAGVLTFIVIGRLGNIRDAGTFSVALGYLALLTTLLAGLDDLFVRENVCAPPERMLQLLVTFGVLRLALAITSWLVLIVALTVLSLYTVNDLIILAVITGCVLPDSLVALGQSVQNARGRFGLPLIAVSVGTLIRLGGTLLMLISHQSLLVVAFVWQVGSFFIAAIMLGILAKDVCRADRCKVRFDSGLARYLVRLFPAFSSTGILAGIEYQLDVILLSVILSHEAVAQYSAAVTIMLIVQMIGQAYRVVLFPALVHSLKDSLIVSRRLIVHSLVTMTIIAVLAATGVTWFAPQLVNLIYGEHFRPAVHILEVLIWNIVFSFLNVPLVRFMMASDGYDAVWRTLAVSVVVNAAANLVLIPLVGVSGSAYARLCSSGLFCLLIGWQVFRRLHTD